ncbi:MAG: 4-(cytidine 5'-diphospho)-2-C-methyl-D-erythritol kinase [Phycisphaeraceae bacterium]|nr:4-(cytidine 5'-diphospho)-2-C-methyl-D-erythritol kinase [Phycisphaeraceae bacterium]
MDLQDASPNRRHTRRTARAKVNLALAVDKPNAEAMHPICSWMARINLADDLHITRLEDDRLSRYAIRWHDEAPIKTNIDWSITADLAVRAHLLLEDETARRLPVQLRLDKRIPVGGGLGGGSADAAATLSAVNELFDLNIPHDRLAQLALTLGSDVPFFLSDHPTGIVSGLGESFEPTAPVSAALVLIFPAFGCPTGPVYRAFDNLPAASFRADTIRALARADSIDSSQLFNDLAPAAEAVAPRLTPLRARAAEVARRPVHITGSGSTMFVVCPEGAHFAADLADDIQSALADDTNPDLRAHATSLVAEPDIG